jgi:hypothetical protein
MHPFYLNDYITRVIRDLKNDKLFITQGIQSTYKALNAKHRVELQWCVVEAANAADALERALVNLEKELEKAHASTKI